MPEYEWWEAYLALPLLLAIGSLIAQFELWVLVTEEAFRKYSKTRRRKMLKQYTLGERLLLRFTPGCNPSRKLKVRLALYYAYGILSTVVIAGPPLYNLFPVFYMFNRFMGRVWGAATFVIILYYGLKPRFSGKQRR